MAHLPKPRQPLPIDSLLTGIGDALAQPGATLVLHAPPGAGKTSRVPLSLLERLDPKVGGQIWMLEPRRIAAKSAAMRLAAELDEPVGQRVGYSVRLESRSSSATRIEVITTGVFLRRLQADPALEGVRYLLFDEFHERSADTDLALALVRQARQLLTPELRIALMSATLAAAPLAAAIEGAQVLSSQGRSYAVAISHQPARPLERLERQVLRALESHWLDRQEHQGGAAGDTALVFLPGQREIQACLRAIQATSWGESIECTPLHGNLPLADQGRAISPARTSAGKVVLATNLAESSLTIAGVTLVIDSGWNRRSRFDPVTGMAGLVTLPASQASADQRAGRAGRLAPGRCVRLWSPAEQQRRPAFDPPELLEADPLPLALQLAQWGDPLGQQLHWLDPPPRRALEEARQLLAQLDALDAEGKLLPHGRQLAQLGLHPRLGHLLLLAHSQGRLGLGCELAALLSERDPLESESEQVGCDLLRRLDWLRGRGPDPRRQHIKQLQEQLRRQVLTSANARAGADGSGSEIDPRPARAISGRSAVYSGSAVKLTDAPPAMGEQSEALLAALLVAQAYPERLALNRDGQAGRFLMRGGRGAKLHPSDPLAHCEALAVASADGQATEARIHLALALGRSALLELATAGAGRRERLASWDGGAGRVRREELLRLDALVLERRGWSGPGQPGDRQAVLAALLVGLRERGLTVLPWTPERRQLLGRLQLAHRAMGAPWPASEASDLLETLDQWLAPHLEGVGSLDELQRLDLDEALWRQAPWERRRELDRLLPMCLKVPSGRQVPMDYGGERPVLAVKLQEMFGLRHTPTVLDGTLAVTVHLLTPAGQPAAITQDLGGFWDHGYDQVRRELRGRYPKHPWPQDPREAVATAFTKARLARQAQT
jgi:ATP-dependent helicase HrpB